ncbi:MAG: sugar transferase [Alphaproteobacteria bacterium]|nr:sugar transferase [Alphaproteobacteria bacterium]MBU2083323.1 sugar transferase [Alphaproteobacteria bacterium]MBU2143712.1 sugar transferase [Alphaproteobacteria bacterium]MBU2195607.1 sugar transferase [Alphaproteobacteria bacterium]
MRQPSNGDHTQCKRILDIVVAGAALLFVAPLILGIALLIRLQDGSRAFYSQKRFGLNGETFNCFKLRSMVPDAREQLEYLLATDPAARAEWDETQKLTNDPRITALGNFIRKTSIDELPQLYNVLRGDMSLVGPRPIVESEIARYGESFRHYCSVRPGITGLWQVSGRSDTTYPERVATDVEYVRSRSFWGDIKIMLMTVPAVLISKGAR